MILLITGSKYVSHSNNDVIPVYLYWIYNDKCTHNLPSLENEILPPWVKLLPSLNQVITGSGDPSATQFNTAVFPLRTVKFSGTVTNRGDTERK